MPQRALRPLDEFRKEDTKLLPPPAQFDDIQPALAPFNLGNLTLGKPCPGRQNLLIHPCLLPDCPQEVQEDPVFWLVMGLFHVAPRCCKAMLYLKIE